MSDAAQQIFHLAGAQFGIEGGHGCYASQSPVGTLEPSAGSLTVSQAFARQGEQAGHAIESIGFELGQPAAPATLQTAYREVKSSSQFFEG